MSDTIRVLVIEDEVNIRLILQYNLEMDGFEVHVAENGRLGLEAVGRVRPDLVLCDWMMPEMNGVEVVRELKDNPKTSHIPIFMLTAKSMVGDVEEAFKAGADDYITKPFDPLRLTEMLRHKLARFERTQAQSSGTE